MKVEKQAAWREGKEFCFPGKKEELARKSRGFLLDLFFPFPFFYSPRENENNQRESKQNKIKEHVTV